ncbi:GTPase domain-containing protein [Sphingobium yanoikuyae]|uniref:GTPase domain-containing protein n=1 Tax=Sphingobium yanoikuyae TaxID=13690 RepID=UPI002FDDDD86
MFKSRYSFAEGENDQTAEPSPLFELLQDYEEDTPSGPEAVAVEILIESKRKLRADLANISLALDWSEPNIAFYGETNAGKSTLIEALRILYGSAGDLPGDAIGDGSPDFTRVATAHACQYDGAHFNLVDVPGIEGDEAKVATAIQDAVHRAHAVFYVTADARPPQGGDEDRMGTLEKIRSQLKPQANVWAVYNKKVNNPRQVGASLVNEDEVGSLSLGENSLDGKMREVLGIHYQGHIVLSALPGFLALADNLPPNSRFTATRAKFLDKLDGDDLLAFSNLKPFAEVIRRNVPTVKEIADANIGKLVPPILDTALQLEKDASAQFTVPAAELKAQLTKLTPQLELIAQDASKGLLRLTDEITNRCIKRIREKMMTAIDKGLWGDAALKAKFDEIVAEEKAGLSDVVYKKIRATAERTMKSCHEVIAVLRHDLKSSDAFKSATFTASFSHALEANGGWGIDGFGLGGAALSLALGVATGGWSLILTGIGAAIGIFRSIRKSWDKDYHKSEQKRSLNKGLDEVKPKIHADILQALQRAESDLRAHALDTIKPFLSIERQMRDADRKVRCFETALREAAQNKLVILAYAERGHHNDITNERA